MRNHTEIAAIRAVFPEARRHGTGHPHRVDPPQIGGVADRRAIDWFLFGSHAFIVIGRTFPASLEPVLSSADRLSACTCQDWQSGKPRFGMLEGA